LSLTQDTEWRRARLEEKKHNTDACGGGTELAEDPDPRTSRALAEAASDKSWIVRAAALEAIAKRGDPALLETAAQQMSDKKDIVRFSAAAAVIHLSHVANERSERNQ